ncbi:MAG: NAD(P)/FAD-dependent oxidoreductase [Caulobacteraceae bacterium]
MSEGSFDVLVIGAGIAGASLGACLASRRRIAILERESLPGYHSTGRSAAVFSETYGNAPVRALSRASRALLFEPPAGFCDHPLVARRGSLHIAREDQRGELEAFLALPDVAANAHAVGAGEAMDLCPILRPGYAVAAAHEPGAHDVDVAALHQGYLRLVTVSGGRIVTGAEVGALEHGPGGWRVMTSAGVFEAAVVVNAAGAWADSLAALAGLAGLDIVPRRRTAILVDAPPGIDIAAMPNTIDIDERFYFKPESGGLFLSPADETPSPPCDAQPDELDVAVGIDRVQTATILEVDHVRRKWAGLRSFAPDRTPVIGFDARAEGFFWLAGQGGYGIQTAPAAARLAAGLILDASLADELAAYGVSAHDFTPDRFGRSTLPRVG